MSLAEYETMRERQPQKFADLLQEDEHLIQVEIPANCPMWRQDELVALFLADLQLSLTHGHTQSGMRLCAIIKRQLSTKKKPA